MPVGGGFLGRGAALGLRLCNELPLGQHGQLAERIFHTVGQGAVCQQDLSGLRQGVQRNGQKSGEILFPQQLLHELRPVAGAAEHQGAELHFLIVGHIADGGIQVAAIAWQLLGRYRQQQRGGCVLRIGAAAEGVKVDGGTAPQPGSEVLPLGNVIAQLSGHQPCLQQAVQLQSHFFGPGFGGSLQIGVVAQNPEGILRSIVRCRGHVRIDEGHIPVRS